MNAPYIKIKTLLDNAVNYWLITNHTDDQYFGVMEVKEVGTRYPLRHDPHIVFMQKNNEKRKLVYNHSEKEFNLYKWEQDDWHHIKKWSAEEFEKEFLDINIIQLMKDNGAW